MNGKQRFFATLLAVISAVLLWSGCSAKTPASADAAIQEPEAVLYAVKVGKGDALIVTAGAKNYLIDAGKRIRWGRVHSALQTLGITRLDGVFLTHTDNDHCGGLMPLALSEIEVGAWYTPEYYAEPGKEKNHPAVKAAAVRGQQVRYLKAGDTAEEIFTVLAPLTRDESNEDDNSLVMRVVLNGVPVLLTGDMEHGEEEQLLRSGAELSCTVLKVPNHGDSDACSSELVAATRPKIVLISTDPDEKQGTPDELMLEDLEEAGAVICRTDLSAGMIRVSCAKGEAAVSELKLPAAADISGITVGISDAKEELITVRNTGRQTVDLTGSYLVSLKSGDVFLFPAGTALGPGGTLTVGTLSTPGGSDLVWAEKKVFSDKKEDGLTLYNACGTPELTYRIGD